MNGVIRAEKRAPAKAHLRMEARQTGCDQITKGLINFFKEFRLYLKGKWGVTEVQGICLDLNVGRTDVCEKILFSQGLHLSSGTILGHSGRQTLGGEVCDFNFKAPFPEQSFSVPHQLTARHSQPSLCSSSFFASK